MIEPVVSEVLEAETAKLRSAVLEQVLERTADAVWAAGNSRLETLSLAIAAVQQAGSQTGILQELLDGLARFGARVAVLLVRDQRATGWQSRGFAQSDVLRRVSIDITAGPAAELVASRTWICGEASALDAGFVAAIGAPASGACVLLPLIVRERLAAIVYADAGLGAGSVDSVPMEILVRSAGLWVEVVAMRKAIGNRPATPPPTAASVRTPMASEPVAHPEPVVEEVQLPEEVAEQGLPLSTDADSAAAPLRPVLAYTKAHESPVQPQPISLVPPADHSAAQHNAALRNEPDELRRKARRFARLLIDEIKLYNESKLAEGRRARDVYARLKEEIDRSRAIYDKRYAQTPVASDDYFTKEVLENLAEGDPSLLGGGFSR